MTKQLRNLLFEHFLSPPGAAWEDWGKKFVKNKHFHIFTSQCSLATINSRGAVFKQSYSSVWSWLWIMSRVNVSVSELRVSRLEHHSSSETRDTRDTRGHDLSCRKTRVYVVIREKNDSLMKSWCRIQSLFRL